MYELQIQKKIVIIIIVAIDISDSCFEASNPSAIGHFHWLNLRLSISR